MNQTEMVKTLNKFANKKNLDKAVALATAVNPAAGIAAAIVGAILVRGIAAADQYIENTYEAPLIPPPTPYILSFTDSMAFLEEHNLIENFRAEIDGVSPTDNPANYEDCENEIMDAASFMRKAVVKNDPIFNAFFFGYIKNGNLLKIWEERKRFGNFKSELKKALPPAKFTPMSQAIWEAVTDKTSLKEMQGILKDAAGEYMGDVNLDKILIVLGE